MRVYVKHSGQHKRHLVNASCQHHHPAPKGKASLPPCRTDPFHQGRQAQVSLIVLRARIVCAMILAFALTPWVSGHNTRSHPRRPCQMQLLLWALRKLSLCPWATVVTEPGLGL